MTARTRELVRPGGRSRDWQAEYAALSVRDRERTLGPTDLERLGMAAYCAGDESAAVDALTRAHTLALEHAETRLAARAAFWIAFSLIGARDFARAAGWTARARRLLEEKQPDCVERGYIMLPAAIERLAAGDLAGAEEVFAAAEQMGERFADRDLTSLARQGRGRVLVAQGRVAAGVQLFDEVMVSVTAGEVTPIVSGAVYCSVIAACFDLLDIRRAQAWTEALNDWCESQPGLVPYRGECRAHRAEILKLRGRWPESIDEAVQACDALAMAKRGQGLATYALGELYRLRGEVDAAEAAYGRAAQHGRSPQPGLALLRLVQGDAAAARAAIDRLLAEPMRGRQRADVLAAAVEVLLATGDVAAARGAADDLRSLAETFGSDWLRAIAEAADGAVHLADGAARAAIAPLRRALGIWSDLDVPYEAARLRLLVSRACRALGDLDGARLESQAAADAFRGIGATPALAEAEALLRELSKPASPEAKGLTTREVEVLRLVASGKTNRAIARDLRISEKTVARHVSNIFTKLDLPSRAAATAYAFTHGLAP
jgi:DNA-binding CsgD family transcriptional regulator